jgi:hypothetical protein
MNQPKSSLKSERVQDAITESPGRLKSERVQSTVLVAEVALASQGPDGATLIPGEEVTMKVSGRRRVRSGSEETVTDFAVKVS